MDDYECPKCTRKAITVKYHERRTLKPPPVWVMEYRCPRGHKWNRVMNPVNEKNRCNLEVIAIGLDALAKSWLPLT